MCGRFWLKTPPESLAALLEASLPADVPPVFTRPRYNIAPGQDVVIGRADGRGAGRVLAGARWGLVPHWAREASFGARTINARSETADVKPAFRDAFRQGRCVIPADGFYEWKPLGGRRKQPMAAAHADGSPMVFAGLWGRWRPEGAAAGLDTCTVLTCPANPALRGIHERMPVVLAPSSVAAWLDTGADPGRLKALLRPEPAGRQVVWAVGPGVNAVAHDGPELLAEVEAVEAVEEPGLFG